MHLYSAGQALSENCHKPKLSIRRFFAKIEMDDVREAYEMYKYAFVTVLIIGSVMGLYLSFDAVLEAQRNKVEPPADNELRLEAKNYEFDQEEYVVTAGKPMVLSLTNNQGRHGYKIEEFGIEVIAGESVEYTFEKPGTYEIHCSIACGPGHEDMASTLIVEEASENPEGEGEDTPDEH